MSKYEVMILENRNAQQGLDDSSRVIKIELCELCGKRKENKTNRKEEKE
jgi:hypothetical protein